jgi:hypothetical protein
MVQIFVDCFTTGGLFALAGDTPLRKQSVTTTQIVIT